MGRLVEGLVMSWVGRVVTRVGSVVVVWWEDGRRVDVAAVHDWVAVWIGIDALLAYEAAGGL